MDQYLKSSSLFADSDSEEDEVTAAALVDAAAEEYGYRPVDVSELLLQINRALRDHALPELGSLDGLPERNQRMLLQSISSLLAQRKRDGDERDDAISRARMAQTDLRVAQENLRKSKEALTRLERDLEISRIETQDVNREMERRRKEWNEERGNMVVQIRDQEYKMTVQERQRRKEEIEMQKLKDKLNSLLAGGSSSRGSTRGAAAPNIIIPSLLPDNMVSSARRKHGMESQTTNMYVNIVRSHEDRQNTLLEENRALRHQLAELEERLGRLQNTVSEVSKGGYDSSELLAAADEFGSAPPRTPQGKFALPYQFLRSAVEGTLQEQLVTLEAKVEELSVAGLQAAETNQRLRSEDPLVIKGLKQLEQHDRRSLEETIREYVDIIRQQQSLIRYAVSSTPNFSSRFALPSTVERLHKTKSRIPTAEMDSVKEENSRELSRLHMLREDLERDREILSLQKEQFQQEKRLFEREKALGSSSQLR